MAYRSSGGSGRLQHLPRYAALLTSSSPSSRHSSRDDRPNYKRLIEAVRKRQLDVVLVWRYDRFARSTQALVNALTEFKVPGVDFISYQENVDTTTPQRELVFGMMASLAQFESSLIGERVRAGMARARAQGKLVSRPPIADEVKGQIETLWTQGRSMNAISQQLGIGYGTVWKYVQLCEQTQSKVPKKAAASGHA